MKTAVTSKIICGSRSAMLPKLAIDDDRHVFRHLLEQRLDPPNQPRVLVSSIGNGRRRFDLVALLSSRDVLHDRRPVSERRVEQFLLGRAELVAVWLFQQQPVDVGEISLLVSSGNFAVVLLLSVGTHLLVANKASIRA